VSVETRFVLVEIGCLECSIPSRLLGIFASVPEAQVAAHKDKNHGVVKWNLAPVHELDWHGQALYAIWDADTLELQVLGS
jgi:hypothetical protein